jgi:hypothetical protein
LGVNTYNKEQLAALFDFWNNQALTKKGLGMLSPSPFIL